MKKLRTVRKILVFSFKIKAGQPAFLLYKGLEVFMRDIEWVKESVFYHIYPLGAFGCPRENQGEKTAFAFIIERSLFKSKFCIICL